MKHLKLIALGWTILATIPFLTSCLDDEDSPQQLLSMSTIYHTAENKGFYFALDNGKTMFAENAQKWGNEYAEGQRAFVLFRRLEQPIAGYDYNIHAIDVRKVLTKDVIFMNEGENTEEQIGDDNIEATYMWVNKNNKYLTIEFKYYGTHSVDKKHFLNLVVNNQTVTNNGEAAEETDPEYLALEFRHHSKGDLPQRLGEGYVSFSLTNISRLMAGKKGLKVRVKTLHNGIKHYKINFPS